MGPGPPEPSQAPNASSFWWPRWDRVLDASGSAGAHGAKYVEGWVCDGALVDVSTPDPHVLGSHHQPCRDRSVPNWQLLLFVASHNTHFVVWEMSSEVMSPDLESGGARWSK